MTVLSVPAKRSVFDTVTVFPAASVSVPVPVVHVLPLMVVAVRAPKVAAEPPVIVPFAAMAGTLISPLFGLHSTTAPESDDANSPARKMPSASERETNLNFILLFSIFRGLSYFTS